ncbi:Alpha/Beta hydrolase protein [Staphylotrichum tortipilum]|uniref:Alpha/Beta hydrolase protein n=1 Tax=Staphylotrichum tortipilum TaxID=2831512 RepID=A0AAN6MI06_9PEZI|nr:Alpha/Beta hydrolase protein [Staphylotrichum longicolle]
MDCERAPLLGHQNPLFDPSRAEKARAPPTAFRHRVVKLLLVAIFGNIFLILTLPYVRPYFPFQHHALHYPGERIEWAPCGTLADRALECATIPVPMDHFASDVSVNKVFTVPLLRMRSPNDTAINLLLNPGGPGGSGTSLVHRKGAAIAEVVGDGFHLLGFDPRGMNDSRPLATCYPTADARRDLADVRAKKLEEDSGELWAWTRNYVRACKDTMGEFAGYVNTPQTAADMNSILDAVGQQGLFYWGFSYGTLLGQTYATLFPERSERVIIDGVANQFDWYDALLDAEMLVDTDRVFDGFVDECVKAGKDRCALAGMASSKEALRDKLVVEINKLWDEPVPVYVNNTIYGVLDYWAVWGNGVFSALYRPAGWADLASNLAALLQGNATAAFLAYGMDKAWDSEGDGLNFVSLNDGASGPNRWQTNRTSLVSELLPFFNQSLFSDTELDFYFAKQAWAVPRTHSYVPKRGVKTARPLLLLSTTYDPVCPLVSARSAKDAFEGSQIVEVKGYGHCSLAVPSLCVANHVRTFLYEGRVPEEYTVCEADGTPYFAKPEDHAAFVASASRPVEEQRIMLAQQELARDSWLGPRRGW